MDTPVVRDESEAVYVSNLAKFARDADGNRYPENWLVYCMLPWVCQTLPFLEGSKVWWNATKFERRYQRESKSSYLVEQHKRKFFLVPPKERRRLYTAKPVSLKS